MPIIIIEMNIDNILLDKLSTDARTSARLRMNFDLRNSDTDSSQRMLNAIEPCSVIPIHRHSTTSETVVVIRGKVVQHFYDDEGNVTDSIYMQPGGPTYAMNVPIGQWHRIESLESGTVILEFKNGPYVPITGDDVMGI